MAIPAALAFRLGRQAEFQASHQARLATSAESVRRERDALQQQVESLTLSRDAASGEGSRRIAQRGLAAAGLAGASVVAGLAGSLGGCFGAAGAAAVALVLAGQAWQDRSSDLKYFGRQIAHVGKHIGSCEQVLQQKRAQESAGTV
ncbi:MAG: hypothetical protein U0931_11065 [Vulcanimicrobiota bacterium]